MIDKLKGYLAKPEVRSALYKLALMVAAFLAAKYAIDGNLLAIVNGLLAVLFGVANANVPSAEPVAVEPQAEYPEPSYLLN